MQSLQVVTKIMQYHAPRMMMVAVSECAYGSKFDWMKCQPTQPLGSVGFGWVGNFQN